MMLNAGFRNARQALQTLREMPLGERIMWFQGQLAQSAGSDLHSTIELLNFLAHRGAIICCQAPIGYDDSPQSPREWTHYVQRVMSVNISDAQLASIIEGRFTNGMRQVELALDVARRGRLT